MSIPAGYGPVIEPNVQLSRVAWYFDDKDGGVIPLSVLIEESQKKFPNLAPTDIYVNLHRTMNSIEVIADIPD